MRWLLAFVATGLALAVLGSGDASAEAPKPLITMVSVSHETAKSAAISALIKPEGLETRWLIDVSKCPASECEVDEENSVETVASGTIPGNRKERRVHGSVRGWWLDSGKTYDYWIIAHNDSGGSEEVRGNFETTPAPGAPLLSALSATGITEKSATLSATLEPGRSAAKYELWVEYQACGPHEECVSFRQASLGTGHVSKNELVSVTASFSGGCAYAYWFVATNSAGRTSSRHERFETPGEWLGCGP